MVETRTGSKQLLRDLNQSIVFNLIARHPAISRTDLARRSGLPAATITRITGDFLLAGLLSETPSEETKNGRRPVLLSINPTAGYVVGVKLFEGGFITTLCDLQCAILHTSSGTLGADLSPHRVIETLVTAVKTCIKESGVQSNRVLGVGVGLDGWVDSTRGVSVFAPMLHWHNFEMGPALEYKLRLPVRIDNDVNTLAIAERQFGSGRDVPNFLLLIVGRGVGAGIVIKGEIYQGSHGGAGEFGHMTVDTSANAPRCNCGKLGCLEAFISDYALVRAGTNADTQAPVTITSPDALRALIEQAQAGDAALRAVFTHAGTMLGITMANLINLFNPDRIIIEGLPASDLMLEPAHTAMLAHTFGPPRQDLTISVQMSDEKAWARGAACLILRELFQAPIYEQRETIAIDQLLAHTTATPRKKK